MEDGQHDLQKELNERRRSRIQTEKELFPRCIQVKEAYTNKRKTLNYTKLSNDLDISLNSTRENMEEKMQSSTKRVNEWLDKTVSIQSPVPRNFRQPFGEINVNVPLERARSKTAEVKDNVKSLKRRSKSEHFQINPKKPLIVEEFVKTKQKVNDDCIYLTSSQESTQSNSSRKFKLSLNRSKRSLTSNFRASGSQLSDDVVIIEDSQDVIDKDKVVLEEVAWRSKLECQEKIDYTNEVDIEQPLTHFECEATNSEQLIKYLELSIKKYQDILKCSEAQSAQPLSELNVDEHTKNKYAKLTNLFTNDSVKEIRNTVPFYKKSYLAKHKKRINEVFKRNASDYVMVMVRNGDLITNIKITDTGDKIKSYQYSKVDKGVQTGFEGNKHTSETPHINVASEKYNNPVQTNKIVNEAPYVSENLFTEEMRATDVNCSSHSRSNNTTPSITPHKLSGAYRVSIDVHKSMHSPSSSISSVVECTPENRSTKKLSIDTFRQALPARRNLEHCFRKSVGSCSSSCSSNKENSDPNKMKLDLLNKKPDCKDDIKERLPFGVIAEHNEIVRISCSMLNATEMKCLRLLCELLSWSFCDVFDSNVTHLVVSVDDFNVTKRSKKYMQALAAGVWIVSYEWVQHCIENSCHIDEEPFEVLDESGIQSPRMSRLSNTRLLEGLHFICIPPFKDFLDLDILEGIILSCGGLIHKCIENIAIMRDEVTIIMLLARTEQHNISDLISNYPIVPVNYEWVLECLGKYQLFTIKDQLICSPDSINWDNVKLPSVLIASTHSESF